MDTYTISYFLWYAFHSAENGGNYLTLLSFGIQVFLLMGEPELYYMYFLGFSS